MDPIKKQFQTIQKIRLTSGGRAELKKEFVHFMDQHPEDLRTSHPMRSPFVTRLYAGALVMVLFFAYVGSAEAALPGDTMYYFKTHVNEAVVKTLAFTPELRAEVNYSLLERRLEEAVHLARDNQTEEAAWGIVLAEFDKNSLDAQESTQTFIEQEDFSEAISSAEQQQALLDAHEAILTKLSDPTDATAIQQVLDAVEEHGNFAAQTVTEASDKLLTETDIEAEAQESIEETSTLFEAASSTAEALMAEGEETAALEEALEQAATALTESAESLELKEYDEAFLKSEEAQATLTEALIILDTEQEFDVVIDPLPQEEGKIL